MAAAFLCLQLSRFYVAVQLDPVECLELGHSHSSDSSHAHSHDGAEHFYPGDSPQSDPGFFFRHCKDTYAGYPMSPVQPLDTPVTALQVLSEENPAAVLTAAFSLRETDLPPPFHPPRQRS